MNLFIDEPIVIVRQDIKFRKLYITSQSGKMKVLNA